MKPRIQAWLGMAALVACSVGLQVPSQAASNVAATKHNLAVSGPGTVKATSESEVCVFCHTPHNASAAAPLWNRRNPSSAYTPYSSTTAKAAAGQPNGSSLLCLSCHDGTIALGELLNRATPVSMSGATTMPAGSGLLGTDLSDDHPVSIGYSTALINARGGAAAAELADPASLPSAVKLDANGQMQCATCHNAHDDTNGKFLVMANTGSALCTTCHTKNNWLTSSHQASSKTWSGTAPDPWPTTSGTTVAANACENCHRPHSAGGKQGLLHVAAEEGTCFNCHNASFNATTKNIQAEMNKVSRHNVAGTTGSHDPAEPALITTRHVECADCHNPHAARASGLTPNTPSTGVLSGTLAGVRGISIAGVEKNPATREEEICFRCHGDNLNLPTAKTVRMLASNSGATPGVNTRLQFQTSNASFHPVAGPVNATSPARPAGSLKAPWTVASTIKCSDCHNNNAGPSATPTLGTGPNGPHGSTNASLLAGAYSGTTTGTNSGTVCFKCHDSAKVNSNTAANGFNRHSTHIGKMSCNACHDPHGVIGGTATNNLRLFNPVKTNGNQATTLVASFTARTCNGNCHGKNHGNETF